jgi:hypothetical protein
MKNGRENRNNGNQEEGKKEKETLGNSVRSQKGTRNASPKFFWGQSFKVSILQRFKEKSGWSASMADTTLLQS